MFTGVSMTGREPIVGAAAWQGREMADHPRWRRDLTRAEIAEIDHALGAVQGLPWREVAADSFPLPGMKHRFAEIAQELEEGSGMVKLRGLPVERYTPEELRRIWFGIGCHLGRPVFQNRRGELMREIRDEGSEAGQRYGQVTTGAGQGQGQGQGQAFLSSYARTLTNGALHRCRGAALRPAGQGRRGQPARQLRRHPQRDAAPPARSAGSSL
jgi:hypothetical protein